MSAVRAKNLGAFFTAAFSAVLVVTFLAIAGMAQAAGAGTGPDLSGHLHQTTVPASVDAHDCSGPCRSGPECSVPAVFATAPDTPDADSRPDTRLRFAGQPSASHQMSLEPPPPRART